MKKLLLIPLCIGVLLYWLFAMALWPLLAVCQWFTRSLEALTVRLLRRHYRRTRPPHLGDAYPDPDQ